MDSLTAPMGILAIMGDPVPLQVLQFHAYRPDHFSEEHYVYDRSRAHLAINQINGISGLVYRNGTMINCYSVSTLSSFALGISKNG
jgi:hypothetical protein